MVAMQTRMRFLEYIRYTASLLASLTNVKKRKRSIEVYVVLGNESADLDSFASALCYSYFKHLTADSRNSIYLPVIFTTRELFSVRGDCLYACNQMGLDYQKDLIYISELESYLEKLLAYPLHVIVRIILVDQPCLPIVLKRWLKGLEETQLPEASLDLNVVEVVDHHVFKLQRLEGFIDPHGLLHERVQTCASNCTNVAEAIYEYCFAYESQEEKKRLCVFLKDENVVSLLLAAIIKDSENLNPSTGKVTPADIQMVQWLSSQQTYSTLSAKDATDRLSLLYKNLCEQKDLHDGEDLTASIALSRDFKIYEIETKDKKGDHIMYGISSLTLSYGAWLGLVIPSDSNDDDQSHKSKSGGKDKAKVLVRTYKDILDTHMKTHGLAVLMMMFIYDGDEEGHIARKLLLYSPSAAWPDSNSEAACLNTLGGAVDRLKLSIDSDQGRFDQFLKQDRVFLLLDQGEVTYSRKKTQPILHEHFCSMFNSSDP